MPVLLIFLVGRADHARLVRGAPRRHAGDAADRRRSGRCSWCWASSSPALALVALALLLTLPLPVTVALLGPLDWGPVIGGYVATLFLAAAYVAIGLYMSARTDNPIVALILTVLVCGLFYLVGSPTLTGLFGYQLGGCSRCWAPARASTPSPAACSTCATCTITSPSSASSWR